MCLFNFFIGLICMQLNAIKYFLLKLITLMKPINFVFLNFLFYKLQFWPVEIYLELKKKIFIILKNILRVVILVFSKLRLHT